MIQNMTSDLYILISNAVIHQIYPVCLILILNPLDYNIE